MEKVRIAIDDIDSDDISVSNYSQFLKKPIRKSQEACKKRKSSLMSQTTN